MQEAGGVMLVCSVEEGREELLSCGECCMILFRPLGRQRHITGTAVVGLNLTGEREMEEAGFKDLKVSKQNRHYF